ncbi:MAG: putative molybdenum carrier protein [Candidatus Sedimenticola sp. 6PFRAG1]
MSLLKKIVSGGQTGVDRAGLDVALDLDIPCGGWCPKGRRAVDGVIPDKYPLTETPAENYNRRTEWNVRDSDATLILNEGALDGGTAVTQVYAEKHKRLCLVVALDQSPDLEIVKSWLEGNRVRVLNIAGPREEKRPGITGRAYTFLNRVFIS